MIHVLGFPHTELTREFESCAFTARTRVFVAMLAAAGLEVTTYSGARAEAGGDHVPLVSSRLRRKWWPWYDPAGQAVFNDFDPASPGWAEFNRRAIREIRKRAQPGDILAITMGATQQPVAEALADRGLTVVETGIGYEGVWAPYRVFESWAWRNYLMAKERTDDARLFDDVIPRAYDVDEFPAGSGSGGYFLFVGRLMARKGPHIAAVACQRLGAKLIVAGQGVASVQPGRITCQDGTVLEGEIEYAGVVGPAERAKLMGEAIALLCPTLYLEPFGGVSVEAQLTGTPAIVSPSGGLPENVVEGKSGYVCTTLAEFAGAAAVADQLDRAKIREHAQAVWGTDAVMPRFARYFDRLATLQGAGWYA